MKLADDTIRGISKKIIKTYSANKLEDTLELIQSKARLEYEYNQFYTDNESEEILVEISKLYDLKFEHEDGEKTVLFYDGFGLDTRGLVQIYLKAILKNGYKLIYITRAEDEYKQPQVMSIIKGINTKIYHCSTKTCIDSIKKLQNIFCSNSFNTAFLYTTPWDVTGITAFNSLKGKCRRFLINLTDHAFWLGMNSFDYCIEFRNYGAAISKDYRKINSEKLVKLPYYPIINADVKFQGFPFEIKNRKIIFSGGAIYKTFDESNTFYRLVENIVSSNDDVIFVYASDKSCAELNDLVMKYPKKVFRIDERKDLVKVLENSYLYLNTYPISGALMLQYAAIANCIPVSLKRPWDDDASGILLNEELLGETFDDFDITLQEINKLIKDEAYYFEKKKKLQNQVISEEKFTSELNKIIISPSLCIMDNIVSVDTKKFRQTYDRNITRDVITDAVINKEGYKVYKYFPLLTMNKIIKKVKRKNIYKKLE